MKDHPATVAAKTVGLIAAAFGFAIPIMAQQGSPRPPSDVDPARARFEDTSKREMQLRGLGNMPNKPADPKQLQALMAQVQQDFERILTLHNEIVRTIGTNKPLVLDFVSDATAEIRKRATRLQTTLAFEKPDASEQNQYKRKQLNGGQLKDALVTLCKHIESFVTNPVIKTPGTIDAQQSARARRDLEDVMELGDSINKSARRLKERSR
jgi:hypothetical protein